MLGILPPPIASERRGAAEEPAEPAGEDDVRSCAPDVFAEETESLSPRSHQALSALFLCSRCCGKALLEDVYSSSVCAQHIRSFSGDLIDSVAQQSKKISGLVGNN